MLFTANTHIKTKLNTYKLFNISRDVVGQYINVIKLILSSENSIKVFLIFLNYKYLFSKI